MDLLLTDTGDGGEFTLSGGDLEMCSTFYNAVYLSLFGGDAFYNVYETYEQNGSFESALNQPITKTNLNKVETTAKQCLKWLLDEGAADSIDVMAYGNNEQKINVDITINEPNNVSYSYGLIWENQKAILKVKNKG